MATPAHSHADWMNLALSLARSAAKIGEVPVGAVLVSADNQLLATGINLKETHQDPTAHAETLAIQAATQSLKSWRLKGSRLYVTLEPCLMCAGAIYQARIEEVIFAAHDPKHGAMGSLYEVHADQRLNHQTLVQSGVASETSANILKSFFRARR